MQAGGFDLIPSTFDLSKPFSLTPIPKHELWGSVAELAEHFNAQHVLVLLPPNLQLFARARDALHTVKTPSIPLPPEQEDAISLALKVMPKLGILTTSALFPTLTPLARHGTPLYMHIVLDTEEPIPTTLTQCPVAFERHFTPGIPLLFQCGHLASSTHMHVNERHLELFSGDVQVASCACGRHTSTT